MAQELKTEQGDAPDEWKCCICRSVAKDPVTINHDQHVFCKGCIESWFVYCQINGQRPTHPMTNCAVAYDYKLFPHLQLQAKISKFYAQNSNKKKAVDKEHFHNRGAIKASVNKANKENDDCKTTKPGNTKSLGTQVDTKDILTIPYYGSKQYTQSKAYTQIEDRFDKDYKMQILLNTKKPDTLFFKDLNATLLKIGCTQSGIKAWFVKTRENILMQMVSMIYSASKNDKYYRRLSLLTQVTGKINSLFVTPNKVT